MGGSQRVLELSIPYVCLCVYHLFASGDSAPAPKSIMQMHCYSGNMIARAHVPLRSKTLTLGPCREHRSPIITVSVANTGAETSSAPKSNPVTLQTKGAVSPVRPKGPKYVDPFNKVIEAERAGETVEAKVKSLNKGGLVVLFGELKGFIPYNQLAASTVQQGPTNDLSYLVGQTLKAKIVSVDVERKDFVMSEKKAQQGLAMRNIKLDSVMRSVVTSVEDYGVFVDLVDLPGVSGLVHRSEISWDSFLTVDSIIKTGQTVSVKVIELDIPKCRLGLSIRQTQPDPIKVTLDTVQWGTTKSLPAEMQQLMDRIREQPGVEDVHIGRQAVESKIASQELVVYMTKDVPSADGFDIVARLGSVLQEMYVVSKMTREEARALLGLVVRS